MSASVRICHIAEGHGVSVISHGGMNIPYGQHLSFAMPAIAWGERYVGINPSEPKGWRLLGRAYSEAGESDKARLCSNRYEELLGQ